MYNLLTISNVLLGAEKSFWHALGLTMVINSLGTGGFSLRLFCLSLVLRAMERKGEAGGGRQWGKERDRETKPERETMTLEVTHSYHEHPHSEKNNEGFPLPSTAWGQPFSHITLSNPIFCVLHVIICKVLVPQENTESKQCPGLVFICTLKLHCVWKLICKERARGTVREQDRWHVDNQAKSLDSVNLNF